MVLQPAHNYGKKVKVPQDRQFSQHKTEPGTPATSHQYTGQGSRWHLIGSFHTCGAWKDSQNIDINL